MIHVVLLFVGFAVGIISMAILAASGQADEREKAQRNKKRLTMIYIWFHRQDPIEHFPVEALKDWAEEEKLE